MPASPRTTVNMMSDEDRRLCAMLRLLLKEARANYVVWGRMLQGPPGVEGLTPADLATLVEIVRKYQ